MSDGLCIHCGKPRADHMSPGDWCIRDVGSGYMRAHSPAAPPAPAAPTRQTFPLVSENDPLGVGWMQRPREVHSPSTAQATAPMVHDCGKEGPSRCPICSPVAGATFRAAPAADAPSETGEDRAATYDELADALTKQVEHTNFVRTEYQSRVATLEARIRDAERLREAAKAVTDDAGLHSDEDMVVEQRLIHELRAALSVAPSEGASRD